MRALTSLFSSSRIVVANSIGTATCKNLSPLKSNVISFPAPRPIFPRFALIVPSLLMAPPRRAVKPPSKVVINPLLITDCSDD